MHRYLLYCMWEVAWSFWAVSVLVLFLRGETGSRTRPPQKREKHLFWARAHPPPSPWALTTTTKEENFTPKIGVFFPFVLVLVGMMGQNLTKHKSQKSLKILISFFYHFSHLCGDINSQSQILNSFSWEMFVSMSILYLFHLFSLTIGPRPAIPACSSPPPRPRPSPPPPLSTRAAASSQIKKRPSSRRSPT